MTKTKSITYDIAIVGGGMVGSSLALLLAQQMPNLHIALIEAFTLSQTGRSALPSYDDRSSALSLGSSVILEGLSSDGASLWEKLKPYTAAIKHVHVSDRGHPAGTVLDAQKLNVQGKTTEKNLGYVIENRYLGSVLLEALQNCAAVDVLDCTKVIQASPKAEYVELSLEKTNENKNQSQLKSRLLVVADGAESELRKKLGIGVDVKPYGQAAVIANVTTSSFHDHIAYERFTDSGPMALLPLPDFKDESNGEDGCEHRCALVWTIEEDAIDEVQNLSDADFLQTIQKRFGQRLGFFTKVGKRSVYPLALHQAQEQVRHRVVLMGNAAHAMHPVAGQGFNLSLRDCLSLTQVLQQGNDDGIDVGSLSVLQKYVQQQQQDQSNTMGASHALTGLFSTDQTAAALVRNTGLLGLSFVPPLKQWFARQAMGLVGKGLGGK